MVWFRAAVGRKSNADPKWLVPLICRLGGVTKQEIGLIRIFDRETKFEIAANAAPRFASSVQNAEKKEIRIEPAEPPVERADDGFRRPKPEFMKPRITPGGPPNEQQRRRRNKARG